MTETTQTIAIELPGVGAPDSLVVRRRAVPEPAAGEALVRMEATGVSFAEQQMRLGKYYDQPPFPFVPGYDVVGIVEAVGGGVERDLLGRRVAALTKTGAWATHLVVDAGDLVPVPENLGAEQAETLIVNGVTAWRMLNRVAKVRAGERIVVLGAAGGVGSVLVQLARAQGLDVLGVGSTGQQDAIALLGATPIDYRTEDVSARVAELAPAGVDAVFDHVGGSGIVDSWRMLAKGGRLVSYGTAATKDDEGSSRVPVLKLVGRLLLWNALPNGRRAHFFNLWAGRRRRSRFQAELRDDLGSVFELALAGEIEGRVAGRFAISDAGSALGFAEGGGLAGKVLLVPDERAPR